MPPRSTSAVSLSSEPLSIGFLGCGTIAAAIATGVCTQTKIPIDRVTVTRRSAKKSSALAERFPTVVHISDDNQHVVDRSDLVFLAVLPEQTSQVLQDLKFEAKHTLISLVVRSFVSNVVDEVEE